MLLPVEGDGSLNLVGKDFVSLAITDRILFHAIISNAALHISLTSPGAPLLGQAAARDMKPSASAVHKEECIRLLHRKLTEATDVSDTMIATVLTLAAFEVSQLMAAKSAVHTNLLT
jgi:Fungal specific transcription factor domain